MLTADAAWGRPATDEPAPATGNSKARWCRRCYRRTLGRDTGGILADDLVHSFFPRRNWQVEYDSPAEIDGAPFAETMRRLPGRESMPVVLYHPLGHGVGHSGDGSRTLRLAKPVKPSQLLNALVELLAASDDQPAAGAGTPLVATSPAALRILLAEDNPVNQKLAIRMLEKMGYSSDVVANGVEALRALEHTKYDVILIDVQMPEMDGWEGTREIHRRWPREERPRIVAVTANAMVGDAEKCFAAGMDDYVSKPIRAEELKRALAAVPVRS